MNLEEILKSSKNVSLSFYSENNGNLNLNTLIDIGFSYESNTFSVIAPRYNGVNYPFHHGDVVSIIFTNVVKNKKKVFSFKGKILKKTKEKELVEDVIQKISEIEEIQRRNSFRLPITKNAIVKVSDEEYTVLSKNISAGGLRFVVNKRLATHSEVEVTFNFEDEHSITTKARVISSNLQKDSQYKYDTRVEFLGLESHEKDKLINYIFEKQIEMIKKTPNSYAADNIYHMIYGNYSEKRIGPDIISKIIKFLSVFSWVTTFFIVVFILKASPETSYGIGRFFERSYRLSWNLQLLNVALTLGILQVFISTIGLFLKSLRMKRETDKISFNLLFNLIVGIFTVFFTIIISMPQ